MKFRIRFRLEFVLKVDGFNKREIYKKIADKELKKIRHRIGYSEMETFDLEKEVLHLFGDPKSARKKDFGLIAGVIGCVLTLVALALQIFVF